MMVSHGDMSPQQKTREIEVILPTGASNKVHVCSLCTVSELKVICEACFGIPTELQKISLMDDDGKSELQDCVMAPKAPVKLQVPIWWDKFICCILKNETENVFRRVQLPMQQVGKDERIFVALFMGACRGLDDLVTRMAKLKTKVNSSTATDTGRTLLHACALGGSLKCLETIIKHLMSSGLESLENSDVNEENACQIAKRLGHEELAEKLLQYTNTNLTQEESSKNSEQRVETVQEALRPHQRQANTDRKINNEAISSERVVEKNKQNEQGDAKEDITCDDKDIEKATLLGNLETKTCEDKNINSKEEIKCFSGEQELEEAKKTSDMSLNELRSAPVDYTTQLSSDELSRSLSKTFSPTSVPSQNLLSKRRGIEQSIYNVNSRVTNIIVGEESSGEESERKTRLPSLGAHKSLTGHAVPLENVFQVQHRPGRKLVIRSYSTPNSPDMSPVVSPRTSPTSEISPPFTENSANTKSAPNSPLARRPMNTTFRAVGMTARFAMRAKMGREPLALASPNIGNAGVKFDRFRRGSLAVGNEGIKVPVHRGKSRSVCEVTLNESLHNHLLTKTMETEERMELPWNAWIAAKRRESVAQQPASNLAPMPENQQLHVPASPNTRRRSFQQWLNDKDMEQLRQMHEQSQIEERKDAERTGRQVKGKSFEEWLEDKHRESQREKEKLKEKEEAEKSEAEKKIRRRRMSQQKYQSWLQEKELKALEEEEKLLGEAKLKFEKMKVKWEEEDEKKKKDPTLAGKLPVGRTKSCPTSNPGESRKISRQRFSSLQVTSK